MVMGMRWIVLCAVWLAAGSLWGQQGYLQSLDALVFPDSAKIDRLNDHAWSLARKAPDSAELYAEAAIERSVRAGNYPKGLMNAYILLGILNKDRGYYGISVEHYLRALEIAESTGDSLRVSGCLNNLGSVYHEQENYKKSLEYFQRSLAIENKLGKDKGQVSIRLFNIGEAYEKLDSLDKAAAFYYNSLLIEEELKNEEGMFYARLGIGKVETRKGSYVNAQEELRRAMEFARRLNSLPGICETQIAVGNLHLAQRQYALAHAALDSALAKARAYHYQGLEMQALGCLYQVHKGEGDLAAANQALEEYYTLREKVNSATVNSRIGELQMRYELEKKEKEIAMFRKKQELDDYAAKYERKLRNYLLFTVGFAVLLIVFNLRRNRRAAANGQ
jgi:tetratricopeptide (TPR) repeat protein